MKRYLKAAAWVASVWLSIAFLLAVAGAIYLLVHPVPWVSITVIVVGYFAYLVMLLADVQ